MTERGIVMENVILRLAKPLSPLALIGCILACIGAVAALLMTIVSIVNGISLPYPDMFPGYYIIYYLFCFLSVLGFAFFSASPGKFKPLLPAICVAVFGFIGAFESARTTNTYLSNLEIDAKNFLPMSILYIVLTVCFLSTLVLALLFGLGKVSPVLPASGLIGSFAVYLVAQAIFFFSPWGTYSPSIFLNWDMLLLLAFCVGAALVLFSYKKAELD